MESIRWSEKPVVLVGDVQLLAATIATEIGGGQYDGYKCPSRMLADAIAGALAMFTSAFKWRIYADFDESKQVYRVWVER